MEKLTISLINCYGLTVDTDEWVEAKKFPLTNDITTFYFTSDRIFSVALRDAAGNMVAVLNGQEVGSDG